MPQSTTQPPSKAHTLAPSRRFTALSGSLLKPICGRVYTILHPRPQIRPHNTTPTPQPPSKAHNHAPSTPDTLCRCHIPRHNCPPRRTCLHPRPQLPHAGATIRHVSALQGAQTCTLDPRYPMPMSHSPAQLPSKAHMLAPSTPVTPRGRHNPPCIRPPGRTNMHPRGNSSSNSLLS